MARRILLLLAVLFWHAAMLPAQQSGRLDTTTFVVLGEGLAAGMANYGLSQYVQSMSFPAQMAQQMNTAFPQPLIQGPGIADVLGYQSLPVRVPGTPANTVWIFPAQPNPNDDAPTLFVFNLSVPNYHLADSLNRRPISPLIHEKDPQQTAINLILGFPALILQNDVPLWSQFEYAKAMEPTMALVELGYYDVLQAAAAGDPTQIPDPATFKAQYTQVVQGLRQMFVQVIVTTIPDPMDTAYFSSPASVANIMGVPTSFITSSYGLAANDFVTRDGLSAIGNQLIRRNIQALDPKFIMRAGVGQQISSGVASLNAQITAVAQAQGAVVYDMAALFHRIATSGFTAGSQQITGSYLGGFYSLDGYYPAATGHAIIANDILALLNRTYGASFPLISLASVVANDPAPFSKVADVPEGPILLDHSGPLNPEGPTMGPFGPEPKF